MARAVGSRRPRKSAAGPVGGAERRDNWTEWIANGEAAYEPTCEPVQCHGSTIADTAHNNNI